MGLNTVSVKREVVLNFYFRKSGQFIVHSYPPPSSVCERCKSEVLWLVRRGGRRISRLG